MKHNTIPTLLKRLRLRTIIQITSILFLAGLTCLGPAQMVAQTAGEKVSAAAGEAKEKVQEAGSAAATKLEVLWQRIDEARLKNRTPDEIVAWFLMGLLVGGVLSQTTGRKLWTGVVFGLIGSFLGGIVAHVTQMNLGLGPVLIRYEDLLFSLAGGVLVLLVARQFRPRKKEDA